KVPADSQDSPTGEIIGSFETRRQEPNGDRLPREKANADEQRRISGRLVPRPRRLRLCIEELCRRMSLLQQTFPIQLMSRSDVPHSLIYKRRGSRMAPSIPSVQPEGRSEGEFQ